MFLKSVELYGFKSFADRTKFEFQDGITSLLGPNGSGKSNVVDSIKWVLGTRALSAIRASKKEDVIFNGTDTRKPMPMCEVILTLNNEQNFLDIDASEVEIKRRLFRTGENEYYINRNKALYRDVESLFMDTGVGKAAYSILEQGKIDQIISLKPEDRRYIFEEAAGISRFKQQSEDADRKLQKTTENIAQAEVIFKEQERLYNSRKGQAEKLIQSKELNARRERLETDLQLSTVQSFSKLYEQRDAELKEKEKEYKAIEDFLSENRVDLSHLQRELDELTAQRASVTESIHRTEEQKTAIGTEISFYNDRYQEFRQRTKEAQYKAQQYEDQLEKDRRNLADKQNQIDSLKENIALTRASIEKTTSDIEKMQENKRKYQEDIDNLEEEYGNFAQERMRITRDISDLANDIADKLEKDIKGSGYSNALRTKAEKALLTEIARAKNLLDEKLNFLKGLSKVDFENDVYLKALDETDESLRTEFDEIKGLFQEYSGTIPTFLDEFTAPEGTLAKKKNLDQELEHTYSLEKSNREKVASFQGEIERIGNMLLLKDSEVEELKEEEIRFATRADGLKSQLDELTDTFRRSEAEFSEAHHIIETEQSREADALSKVEDAKQRQESLGILIQQYRDDLKEIVAKYDSKNNEITEQNSTISSKFNRKQELMTELATCRANQTNLQEQIQRVYTEFFDNTGKSLKEFNDHEITASVTDLRTELEEVRKKIGSLGYINQFAEDEFNEAKKNYEFYKKNLDDLNQSKNDLEEVIAQIKEKSEEMFLAAYNQISVEFRNMFKILFNGGDAWLSLSDEENILESGIEIKAQPPGKKPATLTLLSGGERSMTAVALLFATYKVKPSPFCILDEIDAALDARNVGAFTTALKDFGEKSQFIIITHNKGTVMGSDSILGVTQQELGVSKMIGYKIEDSKEDAKSSDTLKG